VIDHVSLALLELQSALTARSLYPPSHPHIRAGEYKAFELLRDVTDKHPEVTLFSVGERVIFEGTTLPASGNLTEGLFRQLKSAGVDRITFRRGISASEIQGLLDCLAGAQSLKPTAHVGLGYIQELERKAPGAGVVPEAGAVPLPAQLAEALADVWGDVGQNNKLRTDLLGDIFLTLSRSITESASAVLPLADVKQHDEYTFVHTINVAMLSTALAEAVGFQERLLHELNMAALLHDVGKRSIPKELLNKAGKFTDEEFAIVKRHPVDGARILLATPGVPELAPIVAYEHHVRADGTGYPRVPRGWRLSLASRIVQVADVFDALRTHRPYRPAMPLSKIVGIMQEDVGTLFDADLLDVFLRRVVSRGVPDPAPALVDQPVP
jgi:putative nucleotidyltransferase with HDIG domain